MQSKRRTLVQAVGIIVVSLISFGFGLLYASFASEDRNTVLERFSSYPDQSEKHSEQDLTTFWEVWDLINTKYVTSEMPSDEEKMYGAISGLVRSLDDPYSLFLPPVEAKLFEEDVQGNFSGVGMEVGIRQDLLTVVAPLKGTPAEQAGILSGDIIIAIDGTSTLDININESVSLIRGVQGTEVVLTILREGEEDVIEVPIIRDTINIPILFTQTRDDGIFVIELYSFSATSPELFRGALREFIESGSNKLILDLRGNPGGYFEAAIDIASWFLPPGKIVARESFGEAIEDTVYRSKGYDIFSDSLELAILIDGGSASASEILAGALKDHEIATLVGAQSFGKGSVQELINLPGDTSLKLTIARWLTPKGVSISEEGLTPDIETAITIDEFRAGLDPQLDTAVGFLHASDKERFITKYNTDDESNS